MASSHWRSRSHSPATRYPGLMKMLDQDPREVNAKGRRDFSTSRSCYSGTFFVTIIALLTPVVDSRTWISSLVTLTTQSLLISLLNTQQSTKLFFPIVFYIRFSPLKYLLRCSINLGMAFASQAQVLVLVHTLQ